jgi:hypothetical protein
LEAEVDDDKIIKYKKKDGEQGEMKASSAKTMPKDHPAKIEYDKMTDSDSGDKSKGQALGGSDFERDGGDDKGGEESSPAEKLKSLDAKIKNTTANMRNAGSRWNDPREQEYAAKLRKELDKLEAEREKMVADMGGEPEDEPEKDKDDLGPDRGTDDYGKDDLVVPDNEGDWADEMDAVDGEYEEYKGYMEDSKQELDMARAGGDEEEVQDALERFKDDEAEFIKQRDHRKAMIQKAGDEGWLDNYGDEDLEKEYQSQQKLKNRSGKGGGMIGSIGAREKGQGGSGMYDSIQINGKKYRPIKESKKEEKDFTKLLKENYKRFSRK